MILTVEELKLLKLEHSPKNIIHINFMQNDYVFRNLTIGEYKEATTLCSEKQDLDELICNMTCVYPKDIDFVNCGIANLPTYCSDIIIQSSKVCDVVSVKDTLEVYREALFEASKQAFMIIRLSFPEITKDRFLSMDWNEICEYVAMSEKIQQMKGLEVKLEFNIDTNTDTDSNVEEKEQESNINKEVMQLLEQGIDPYEYYNIPLVNKYNTVPIPLIGGRHWDDQEQMELIRKYVKNLS